MPDFHGRLRPTQIPRPDILGRSRAALARSPVVAPTGPRQSGKTTLARELLPEDSVNYFDLEDPASLTRLIEPRTALDPLHPKLGASWVGFVIERVLVSERAPPQDLEVAREQLHCFFAHYTHFRPHEGIGGMVPADRDFGQESVVREAARRWKERWRRRRRERRKEQRVTVEVRCRDAVWSVAATHLGRLAGRRVVRVVVLDVASGRTRRGGSCRWSW